MRSTPYYSLRNDKSLSLPILCKLFYTTFCELQREGYFQEALGYDCVDAGIVFGKLGENVSAVILRKLHKDNIWPVKEFYLTYTEDDLFDIIEFVFDIISEPIETEGYYHSYAQCGWHYNKFSKVLGQIKFLTEVNELLCNYRGGYQLTIDGEIKDLAEKDLEPLLKAELKTNDEHIIQSVNHAIKKYWSRNSTSQDRKDAIVQLGKVLEPLKKKVTKVLTKDESDLFEILNNFGLRHNNSKQKTDYDSKIFDSWLFYHYLAAVHAYLRLLERQKIETELGQLN